jgi:hypothetical protein
MIEMSVISSTVDFFVDLCPPFVRHTPLDNGEFAHFLTPKLRGTAVHPPPIEAILVEHINAKEITSSITY